MENKIKQKNKISMYICKADICNAKKLTDFSMIWMILTKGKVFVLIFIYFISWFILLLLLIVFCYFCYSCCCYFIFIFLLLILLLPYYCLLPFSLFIYCCHCDYHYCYHYIFSSPLLLSCSSWFSISFISLASILVNL